MSKGDIPKPSKLGAKALQQLKLDGFYQQYGRPFSSIEEIETWVTEADKIDSDTALGFYLRQEVWFLDNSQILPQPVVYIRDLNYTPICYVVAPGVLVYDLPEKYIVPSLLSRAQIKPDLEVESVLYKLAAAIIAKNYYSVFEQYHKTMLYGRTGDDAAFAQYTEFYWEQLNNELQGSEKLRAMLDKCLDRISQEGYTIEAIGLYLRPFIEKALKTAITEGI